MFKSGGCGRNVDPLEWLRPFIASSGEEEICSHAMTWIFLHVKVDRVLDCLTHLRSKSSSGDPIEECIEGMDDANDNEDVDTYGYCLLSAVYIIRAIGFILQQEFFDNTLSLNEAYQRAACRLVPYISRWGVDGQVIYYFVEAVNLANLDFCAMGDLIQHFSLPERKAFKDECYKNALNGVSFAVQILPLLA